MLSPKEVWNAASEKEEENRRFRSYLKGHAEEDTLDAQCQRLHKELFAEMDCSKCRNCCTKISVTFWNNDILDAAELLHITPEQLERRYLRETDQGMQTHIPCAFLGKDGSCTIEACKPEDCRDYPFTNRPGRLWSLYGLMEATYYCPVAFELVERLKQEYHFTSYRRQEQRRRRW